LAAGFNSIRRFNATFQTLYQRPPRELRRSQLADADQPGAEGITLKLPYAPPYDWDAMIDFLGARAIRGIEAVDGRRCYRRSIALDGAQGVIRVEPDDPEPALRVPIRLPQVSALAGIVRRVRLFWLHDGRRWSPNKVGLFSLATSSTICSNVTG
jgi:AraC family transcriptional regulator of adaptative response / DNA-3-methyladenine glycosylase II